MNGSTDDLLVSQYIKKSIAVKEKILETDIELIYSIVREIIKALRKGNKVIWFGNGGSAADAQHLACEMVGKFYQERKAYPSIALTTNTSEITAISNDYGFEYIFERQIEALVKEGDVVIGITTGGNSPNVVRGFKKSRDLGATTVALAGKSGGKIKSDGNVDYLLIVPSEETPHIQEAHIMIGHIICYLVELTMGSYL